MDTKTIVFLVFWMFFIFDGCANVPMFEDGTRTSIYSTPCTTDSCGKLPEGF